jgi:hypothetical protein
MGEIIKTMYRHPETTVIFMIVIAVLLLLLLPVTCFEQNNVANCQTACFGVSDEDKKLECLKACFESQAITPTKEK